MGSLKRSNSHAQYCLPTDSPDLAKEGRLKAGMLSPLVWAQHRPDRFDSYSAGAALLSPVVLCSMLEVTGAVSVHHGPISAGRLLPSKLLELRRVLRRLMRHQWVHYRFLEVILVIFVDGRWDVCTTVTTVGWLCRHGWKSTRDAVRGMPGLGATSCLPCQGH